MAMDMLAETITYAVLFLEDEFDEGIRRGFLLSGGRSFMSDERLRRARERARLLKARVMTHRGWSASAFGGATLIFMSAPEISEDSSNTKNLNVWQLSVSLIVSGNSRRTFLPAFVSASSPSVLVLAGLSASESGCMVVALSKVS